MRTPAMRDVFPDAAGVPHILTLGAGRGVAAGHACSLVAVAVFSETCASDGGYVPARNNRLCIWPIQR